MKSSLISRVVAVGVLGLGCQFVSARNVHFKDLPAAVQREAETELKNGKIKQVESLEQNGRTIYQITYERSGAPDKVIYLDANGTYVNDQNAATRSQNLNTSTPKEVQLSQVPEAVRNTIHTETKNGPVTRIQQMPNNGATMYEVFFRQPNGQEKVIYLNPDGTYVQSGATSTRTRTAAGRSWDQLSGSGSGVVGRQPLSASTKVNFNQLPSAVQRTMRAEAGTAAIESIDRGTLNGQTVYEGAFKRNGQTVKLRVGENGAVLPDLQDSRIVASGPLPHAKKISFNQMPAAVQNTIKAQAGQSLVENVEQGDWNGQTIYQAVVNRNGQLVQLRVSPTGALVSSSQAQSATSTTQP